MKRLLLILLLLPFLASAQTQVNCAPSTPCNATTGPSLTGSGDPAWMAFGKINANFNTAFPLLLPSSAAANRVMASPNGSSGAVSARALVSGDLPTSIGSQLPQIVGLTPNSVGSAAANTTAIQSALTATGLANIYSPGTYSMSGTLVMPSNSHLHLGEGVTLQAITNNNLKMVRNTQYGATQTAVTITSASNVATVAWTAHGLSVGQWVAILNATQSDYDGVFQVASVVDANDFTYKTDHVPVATPATAPAAVTLSSVTYTSTAATATFAANHQQSTGMLATISGGTPACVNVTNATITDATATTVTYAVACGSSGTATGTITYTPLISGVIADSGITIEGPGTLDFNGANQSVSGTLDTMAIILEHVANASVHDINLLNAKKYELLCANCRNANVRNVVLNSISDGLHFQGPIHGAFISDIYGKDGDDMTSFTIGDYSVYDLSRGDFEGVAVKNLFPYNALTCVKIAGNAPYRFRYIDIDSVSGSVLHSCVFFQDDTNLTETDADYIGIHNVRVDHDISAPGSFPLINFLGGSGVTASVGHVVIDNLTRVDTDATPAVNFDTGVTVQSADILNLYDHTGVAFADVRVAGTNTVVKRLAVMGASITPQNNTAASLVQVSASGATVTDLDVSYNYSAPAAGTNARFVTAVAGAAITNLRMYGNTLTGGGNGWFEQLYTTGSTNIDFQGNTGDSFATGFNIKTTTNLNLCGNHMSGITNRLIVTAATAFTTTITGCYDTQGTRIVNLGATSTVNQYGDSLPLDVSNSTATLGVSGTEVGSLCVVTGNGSNFVFKAPCNRNVAFAASLTPVLVPSGSNQAGTNINVGALTAAITVNNPATIPYAGSPPISICFVQDATGGRTVSWGTAYQFPTLAWSNTGNTLSTRSCATFISDGTNLWAQGANAWH